MLPFFSGVHSFFLLPDHSMATRPSFHTISWSIQQPLIAVLVVVTALINSFIYAVQFITELLKTILFFSTRLPSSLPMIIQCRMICNLYLSPLQPSLTIDQVNSTSPYLFSLSLFLVYADIIILFHISYFKQQWLGFNELHSLDSIRLIDLLQ